MNILENIEERLSIFIGLYDVVRIIDPNCCRVLFSTAPELMEFHCLSSQTKCDECIAHKAFLSNNSFQKLEIINDRAFLIITSPLKLDNASYVLELFKDVTLTLSIKQSSLNTNVDLFFKEFTAKITKDSLTNAYNRSFLMEHLNNKLLSNSTNSISIIMIDLDHFKAVNDKYGHVSGDTVLKEFSNIVLNSIRDTDWFCRYGGEEFVIILNNTSLKGALALANRIKYLLSSKVFNFNSEIVRVTCSMGIYSSTYRDATLDNLLKNSDKNLYIAKSSGRNTIIY